MQIAASSNMSLQQVPTSLTKSIKDSNGSGTEVKLLFTSKKSGIKNICYTCINVSRNKCRLSSIWGFSQENGIYRIEHNTLDRSHSKRNVKKEERKKEKKNRKRKD